MEKEKVIVINYTGRKGGGALDAYEAAKALVECREKVIPILSNQLENLEMWRKVGFEKIIEINTYHSPLSFTINSILFPFRQRRIIKKELKLYSVKAVYSPMSSFWTAPINRIFKDAKIIAVNHDPVPHSGASKLAIWLMERPFKKADVVVVHTKKFLDCTRKRYGRTVYLPLGQHNLYRKIENKRKIIGYNPQKLNFLFFGRITKYKGLDVLADAYRKLFSEFADKITLTIVGNGDFSEYAEIYSGLDITVINRWIKDEEVESVFSGENMVCVCPYKDATQSGVILVAYDYGVPVIASNTGGLEEQIVDGETGLLVPPSDEEALYKAMRMFVDGTVSIEFMKSNIKTFMEKVSWKSAAEGIIQLTEEH